MVRAGSRKEQVDAHVQGELLDDGAEILVVGNVWQGTVVGGRVDALVARHVGGRLACRVEVMLAAAIAVGKVEPVLRHSSRKPVLRRVESATHSNEATYRLVKERKSCRILAGKARPCYALRNMLQDYSSAV